MRSLLISLIFVLSFSTLCLADSSSSSALSGLATSIQAAPALTTDSFLGNAFAILAQVKGSVPLGLKIAGVVLLIIAAMKTTFLAPLWNMLGKGKAVLAPVLGLVLGLSLMSANGPLTGASIFAYMVSGGGAIVLHELLDWIKAIPGIGALYVGIINFIESSFLGSKSQ